MSPTAKAVLDATTDALSTERAKNAALQRVVDGFLSSPRAAKRGTAAQVRRDVAAAVVRKGALPGTRGTGGSMTAATIARIKRDADALIAAHEARALEPVKIAGKVDATATLIKRLHAKRGT
jgi:hypothetical protein